MTENKYPVVDCVEKMEQRLSDIKEAQKKYASYTQEQVDAIFKAAAIAANKARIPPCKARGRRDGNGYSRGQSYKKSLCFRIYL